MSRAVDEKDIRSVVDGFKTFFRRVEETQSFNVIGLKNFMEPIFTAAGYRDLANRGGGGSVSVF